ncbi:MAG TPA: DUF202 domain-containing protein [Pyrinomonadaceae bacterium]|jgi:putative membrane protein
MKNESANLIQTQKGAMQPKDLATEYLANERTFLAWVRTGISIIALGFALAKVRVWLGESGLHISSNFTGMGESIPLGIGMVLFGMLLVLLAAWRYMVVNRQIKRGEVTADQWLIVLITIIVIVLSLLMTIYLMIGVEQV